MLKPWFTKCHSGTIVPMWDGVALQFGTCQGCAMANTPRNPTSGGIFIALGAVAGVVAGRLYGEPSIGLVAGVAIGLALAGLIWWRERA